MNFTDLLDPELILCDVKGESRSTVYGEMLRHLKKIKPHIGNVDELLSEIEEHEALIDMPYTQGFAVPHTRSASVEDFYIVIGIHRKGVLLQDNDTEPSKIIILCLISKSTSNIYLLSLKAIYSYFSQDGVSEKVALCKSPDELIAMLDKDGVEVKHSITAEDIMMKDFSIMEESAVLGEAINYFTTSNRNQVPVVDSKQRFIGSVSIESILKADIPKYVMMMDNLEFLSEFEPFEQLLAKEDEMPLKDFINRSPETCSLQTPLMKIVVDLVKRKTNCFYVLDDQKKLVGLISKRELIKNLLRR